MGSANRGSRRLVVTDPKGGLAKKWQNSNRGGKGLLSRLGSGSGGEENEVTTDRQGVAWGKGGRECWTGGALGEKKRGRSHKNPRVQSSKIQREGAGDKQTKREKRASKR